MSPRFVILLFAFAFSSLEMHAAILSGRMTGSDGSALSYAAIYVKGTSQGTTTNDQGDYTLDLPAANYTLIFQAMGYAQKILQVDLSAGNKTLDIVLNPTTIQLTEAVINDGEDPAYPIIRNAIKKRKFYLNQVESYSCDVYIKGLQRITEHPEKIMGIEVDPDGEIDTVSGIVYLSESVSKFNFKQTDKIKEEMVSSKVSGDNQAFSYNRASDMMFNFYENVIEIEDLSERGFVSPIANDAMLFYRYRMVGTILENDSMINKIEVIPRRKSDPCFRGYIYIMQNSWRIHSTELYLTKDAQIDFVDTLLINQTFVPVEKDVWMVFMNKFTFDFGFMGLKGNGFYVGVNRNYILTPDFPKKFFDNEEMHVNDDANLKDSVYWGDARPIPLTGEEAWDYHKRDSIMRLHNSKDYLDSLDQAGNKPKIMELLFSGYFYERRYNKFSVGFSPVVAAFSYNTVQGVRTGIDFDITKRWENRKWLNVNPAFSYGFANARFYSDLEMSYFYKPVRFSRITVAGGSATDQFSNRDPVPVFINTLYTLLDKRNYLKIYEKNYANVDWYTEIVNGVMFNADVEYAQRNPLKNSSLYYWGPFPERHFTSNNPLAPQDYYSDAFTSHKSLELTLQASIRYKQKYYTRPNQKIILGSKYPTLGIMYRRGTKGVFGSATDYDFAKVSLRDELNLKLFGKFSYYIAGGKFLRKGYLPFMDYYHFLGNQTIWSTFPQQSYQLLPYYTYSTNDWFFEAHAEHHFGGFILNKIPLLRRLKLTEVVGVNYLVTNDVPSYYEFYFGADKLGLIRVDFAFAYMQNAKVSAGLRIGVRL
ncbi:MAG: DUF5686 and carboxypeptidase regulatory-like domain-containing protein [Bacteroidia bacterium]